MDAQSNPPDGFMLSAQARLAQRRGMRLYFTVPLAVLTILAVVLGIFTLGWAWSWALPSGLTILAMLACMNFVSTNIPERPRPETDLEAAVIVGVEITSWAHADRNGFHEVRVIGRPLRSESDQLVHCYQRFHADGGCPLTAGMMFGFRRHPTMTHLVWVDSDQNPLDLLAIRDGSDRPPTSPREDATVESVSVAADSDGDWWRATVAVRTADGAQLTDSRYRLPEELGQFEPGHRVQIVRSHLTDPTCSIVPLTL